MALLLKEPIPFYATPLDDGIEFWIKVTPKSSTSRVGKIVDGTFNRKFLKVYVACAPEDGKANMEVLNVLANHFQKPVTNFKILSGFTTREKRIFCHKF